MASNEGGEGVSNTESSNAKQIWQTLSKLNVNDHTEKKGHLTYLSWAWAYQTMMDHFPDMQIIWSTFRDVDGMDRDVLYYPDRSCSVHCTVVVQGVTRHMWLPVMDNRNNAVQNPDARAISDTKMRCLVKCFALFGLGLYIFAGSDLPEEEEFVAPNRVKTPEEHQAFLEAIEKHVAKFKAKVELNGFFRKLEPWFSDLREITDADGVTGYDDLVKKFKMYATKVK
jgi:hypothetical protein